jgi:hypothetical protein
MLSFIDSFSRCDKWWIRFHSSSFFEISLSDENMNEWVESICTIMSFVRSSFSFSSIMTRSFFANVKFFNRMKTSESWYLSWVSKRRTMNKWIEREFEYLFNRVVHEKTTRRNDELIKNDFVASTRRNFMIVLSLDDADKHKYDLRNSFRELLSILAIESMSSASIFYVLREYEDSSWVETSHFLHLWALSHCDHVQTLLL